MRHLLRSSTKSVSQACGIGMYSPSTTQTKHSTNQLHSMLSSSSGGSNASATGSTYCVLCPQGTSQNFTGPSASAVCAPGFYAGCQPGSYQPPPASSACVACLPGASSLPSASSCVVCPDGTYLDNLGCATCPAGQIAGCAIGATDPAASAILAQTAPASPSTAPPPAWCARAGMPRTLPGPQARPAPRAMLESHTKPVCQARIQG